MIKIKYLLLLTLAFSCISAKEKKINIINGKETNGFEPVTKITTGNQFRDNLPSKLRSHCSGVVVGKQTILTAAHCISEIFLQQNGYYSFGGLTKPFNKSMSLQAPQVFLGASNQRITSYLIHPLYLDFLTKRMEDARSDFPSLKEKKLIALRSRYIGHDLALLFFKQKFTKAYQLCNYSLLPGDDVLLVGYGMHIDSSAYEYFQRLHHQWRHQKSSRYFDKIRLKKLTKLLQSVNFDKKRFGQSRVSDVKDSFYLNEGRRKPYLSAWDKIMAFTDDSIKLTGSPDGKNVGSSSGDSGGAMLRKFDQKYKLCGIIHGGNLSEKDPENLKNSFIVNLNAPENIDFLRDNIR